MSGETNPYQTPVSEVTQGGETWPVDPAGKGLRFLTFVIDYACVMGSSYVLGFTVVILFGEAGLKALQSIPQLLLGVLLLVGFYVFFEGIWARTPGKFLCGTIVVNDEGQKPSLGKIIKRTFCRFIPFEVFSFLGDRGWHDSLSDTYVVAYRRD